MILQLPSSALPNTQGILNLTLTFPGVITWKEHLTRTQPPLLLQHTSHPDPFCDPRRFNHFFPPAGKPSFLEQALRGRLLTQPDSDTVCLETVSDPTSGGLGPSNHLSLPRRPVFPQVIFSKKKILPSIASFILLRL